MFSIEDKVKLPSPVGVSLVSNLDQKKHPKCNICGLVFKKSEDLKLHLEEDAWNEYQKQTNLKSIKCRCCGMFFSTRQGYKQHVGKVHIKSYKYSKCPICKKKFRNKYAVKFHVKQVHDKSTREDCEICGKEFYNKYLLPRHMKKCLLRKLAEN